MIDLFALFDHNALCQLFSSKADSRSCGFLTVLLHTALHHQTACLAVGCSQTSLDHQGQDADGTIGQVGLGHVEELENVIVARAVNVVGIGAGLGDSVAAVGLGLDRFELLEDFSLCGIAVCRVALVDFETDDLG